MTLKQWVLLTNHLLKTGCTDEVQADPALMRIDFDGSISWIGSAAARE
jgi:hypothetical protein